MHRGKPKLSGNAGAFARPAITTITAQSLDDLRSPPGNRLEALRGDLKGFYSIRINKQWRIIFRWQASDAHEVRVVDYH